MKPFEDSSVLYLRKATEEDEKLLLEWANDKSVRENAFNQHIITENEHRLWFKNALRSSSVMIFILMKDDEPIGQCRLTVDNNGEADIDYSIDQDARGNGLGRVLLDLMEREIYKSHMNIKTLIGRVKPSNIASSRCFENSGYSVKYKTFEKEIKRDI